MNTSKTIQKISRLFIVEAWLLKTKLERGPSENPRLHLKKKILFPKRTKTALTSLASLPLPSQLLISRALLLLGERPFPSPGSPTEILRVRRPLVALALSNSRTQPHRGRCRRSLNLTSRLSEVHHRPSAGSTHALSR